MLDFTRYNKYIILEVSQYYSAKYTECFHGLINERNSKQIGDLIQEINNKIHIQIWYQDGWASIIYVLFIF